MTLVLPNKCYIYATGIVLSVFCFSSVAAIYKWTDKSGKVHYSDKKLASNAKEENVNIGTMPNAQAVTEITPKKYMGSYLGEWVSVTEPFYQLQGKKGREENNLFFYFGGDCVSSTYLSFNEFVSNYANILDSTEFLQRIVVRRFEDYAFNVLHSASNVRPMYKNKKRHNLHIAVIDLKINACSKKSLQQSQFGLLNNFNVYSFYKSNAWVKLKWTLVDQNTRKVIFTAYSEGAADNIKTANRTMALAYRGAFSKAAINFLADEAFLNYLNKNQPKNRIEYKQEKQVENKSILPGNALAKSGALSETANSIQLGYLKSADFGQAFSLVIPLKAVVTSYYLAQDVWPISFRDISIEESSLRERGLIRHVGLRGNGVIHVALDDDKFGVGHYFQLVPHVSMGRTRLKWDCVTTLDKSYGINACVREL